MFAVIRTGGKQIKIKEGDIVRVEKLNKKEGEKIIFEDVALLKEDEKLLIGNPIVLGAKVEAVVLRNLRDKKVIIFKKKKRKHYKKKTGHRQYLSEIKIEKISIKKRGRKPKENEETSFEVKNGS